MLQKLGNLKNKFFQEKQGVGLGELFPAFVIVAAIFVLIVLLIYIFGVLGASFTAGSAEANASADAVTNTARVIPLVGILFVILAVGAVITILITSMIVSGRNRA